MKFVENFFGWWIANNAIYTIINTIDTEQMFCYNSFKNIYVRNIEKRKNFYNNIQF